MRRFLPRPAVLLTLGLLFLAGPFRTFAAEPAAPPAWSVIPLLPGETLAVVHIPDVKKSGARLKQTGLWALWSDPGVQSALANPLLLAQGALLAGQMRWGFQASALLDLFSESEVTLVLLNVEPRPDGAPDPIPTLLLSIQARAKGPALMDELHKRVLDFNRSVGEALQIGQDQLDDGTLVRSVAVPNGPVFCYAQCDGNVLVAVGGGHIDQLVKLHRDGKTAAGGLAANPAWAATLRNAGRDYDLLAFVNWQAVLKNPTINAGPKSDQERHGWEVNNLRGVRAFSYSLSLAGKGVHEALYVAMPAPERKGLFGLLEGQALKPEDLAPVSRNALLAGAWHGSLDSLLSQVEALAATDPAARAQFEAQLTDLGQKLNLDVKHKLAESFTGVVVCSACAPPARAKLGITFPQVICSVGVKDPVAFGETLKTMLTALAPATQITQAPEGDKVITTVRWGAEKERQLSFVLAGREWLLAAYPLALRAELQRRTDAKTGPLTNDPDFTAAFSNFTGAPHAVFYADAATLAGTAYDAALPILQIKPQKFGVNTLALPSGDVVSRNLCGLLLGLSSGADGVALEGYSPAGMLPMLAGVAAASAWLKPKEPVEGADVNGQAAPEKQMGKAPEF